MHWDEIKSSARKKCGSLGADYLDRLEFEFKEIEKQASESYWEDVVSSGKTFSRNDNGLVLPFLLGITPTDPLVGEMAAYVGEGYDRRLEAVEVEMENGKKVLISRETLVNTNRGKIPAGELKVDDEII